MANFLYNGVELPDISVLDTNDCNYAFITLDNDGVYRVYFWKSAVSLDSNGNYTGASYVYRYCYALSAEFTWVVMQFGYGYGNSTVGSLVWSNYDFLNADGSVYLAASEPVDPNAPAEPETSHITISSGDGFALYNGVKLPNIDALWDKTKYPYAFIIFSDTSAIAPGTGTYEVRFASSEYRYNGTRFAAIEDGFYTSYQIPANQATIDLMISMGSTVAIDKWSLRFEDKEAAAGQASKLDMRWHSFDIEGFGDATFPIPLDGMTVIEWDGVTDGNSIEIQAGYKIQRIGDYLPTNIYGGFVTSNSAADSNPITIYGSPSGSYESIPDSYTAEADIFDNDSWLVSYIGDELDYSVNALLSVKGNLPMSESITVSEGLWVPVMGLNGNIAMYTPLVAYRSAPSNDSTESVITETSGDGFALYNGVKLPKLDGIWTDKSTNVFICEAVDNSGASYFAIVGTAIPYQDTTNGGISLSAPFHFKQYGCFTDEALANQYGATAYTWTYYQEHSLDDGLSNFKQTVIWTSADICKDTDGSTFLTASDPIPLDGMTVIEWNGGTTGLEAMNDVYFLVSDSVSDVSAGDTVIVALASNVPDIPPAFTDTLVEGDGYLSDSGQLGQAVVVFGNVEGSTGVAFARVDVGEQYIYTSLVAYPTSGGDTSEEEPIITQTSGDGFALYNGVKLPKLPERDKTTYPYAVIVDISKSYSGVYILAFTAETANETLEYQGAWITYDIKNGVWFEQGNNTDELDVGLSLGYTATKVVWSNYDILATGGSIYLAASDPVPLDGMSVIEWNGGTAGLANSGTGLYKITNDILASNQVIGGVFVQDVSSKLTAIPITAEKISAHENGMFIGGKIYSSPANTLVPDAGTYFPKLVSDYVSLFAYPTSGENDLAYDRTAFLSGMAMGLTGEGNPIFTGVSRGVSRMCSYNGIELPKLPEWDKTAYPYAVIDEQNVTYGDYTGAKAYWLYAFSKRPTYSNNTVNISDPDEYLVTLVCDEKYFASLEASPVPQDVNYALIENGWPQMTKKTETLSELVLMFVKWTNTDILAADNSVYLVASEPIPVGGGVSGADSFTTGYLVGAALRRNRNTSVTSDILDNTVPIEWNSVEVCNNTKVELDGIEFVRVSSLYATDESQFYQYASTIVAYQNGVAFASVPLAGVESLGGVYIAIYLFDGDQFPVLSIPEDNATIEDIVFPKKGVYVPNFNALLDVDADFMFTSEEGPKLFFDSFPIDIKIDGSQLWALNSAESVPLIQEDGTQNGSIMKISNLTPTIEELNSMCNKTFAALSMNGDIQVNDQEALTYVWDSTGTFVRDDDDSLWIVYEPHTLHTTVFDNSSIALTAEVTPGIYLSDRFMFVFVISLGLLAGMEQNPDLDKGNGILTDDWLRFYFGTAEDVERELAMYPQAAIEETEPVVEEKQDEQEVL